MNQTTNLHLPYLAAAQAQKHVTVNETIRKLDAIVQIAVESATTTAEPGSPSDGQTWIVPAGKTGTNWSGFTNNAIGYYRDGAWEQITPREGWLAWARDTGVMLVYDGSAWSTSDIRDGLGLGSAALKNTGTSGDAVALMNSGFNVWGGLNSFAGVAISPTGGVPQLKWVYDGAAADNQLWDMIDFGSGLQLRALNDAQDAAGSALIVHRSDETISMLELGALTRPIADNSYAFGGASNRWSVIYAASGTINTSDAREKTDLRPLSAREAAAVRRIISQIGIFQWHDAVKRKGADDARLHCGVTAQDVEAAFAAEGLDAARYGLFCADPVYEAVEIMPARVETITGPDGEERRIPIAAVTEQRGVIDGATGAQLIRLGVRYDQVFAMALGGLYAAG